MRKDSFGDLIDRMKEVAYSAMQVKNLHINFDIKNIDPKRVISANIRQNLYLIFKEAINNIVKHSNATKADVFIKLISTQLNISIIEIYMEAFKNKDKIGIKF